MKRREFAALLSIPGLAGCAGLSPSRNESNTDGTANHETDNESVFECEPDLDFREEAVVGKGEAIQIQVEAKDDSVSRDQWCGDHAREEIHNLLEGELDERAGGYEIRYEEPVRGITEDAVVVQIILAEVTPDCRVFRSNLTAQDIEQLVPSLVEVNDLDGETICTIPVYITEEVHHLD